ncbi:hypothetical protein ACT3UQ_08935 [Glutamicibacter sp. AOP12-B1-11]|uniref:hypothetical protein n=1 Tax=Glutamicibacter sp. AOP12-B1-11 TaxID=3457725 RepID=UPI0040346C27
MGANEKHEAAYHGGEYVPDTPTTEQIRSAWTDPAPGVSDEQFYSAEAFDRWLSEARAEAKAEVYDHLAATAHNRFEKARMTGLAHETRHGPTKLGGAFSIPETENKENKP